MRWIASLLALTLLLAAVPMASGHAAPAPAAYETRLLHDHNDDSVFLVGQHGFDTIALDAREATFPDGTPAMVLKLILNRGCDAAASGDCGELTLDVQFDAGGPQSVQFTTPDGGATWTGNAAKYGEPTDINDGTRFAIEAWIRMADFGLAPGVEATDWFVEAADNMPEGAVPGYPDPLGAAFDIGSYAVKAPDFYLNMTVGDVDEIEPGQSARPVVTVENLLDTPQRVTVRVDGVNASSIDLAPLATGNVTLDLAPEESREYTITAASNLGGYEKAMLPIHVHQAAADDEGGSDPHEGHDEHGGDEHGHGDGHDQDAPAPDDAEGEPQGEPADAVDEEAPGAGLLMIGAALLGLAVLRRR